MPTKQLFADAHHALLDQKFNSFEDQIIAVADYIIGRLNDDHGLLTFISKNLSWGIFKTAFENETPIFNKHFTPHNDDYVVFSTQSSGKNISA